MYHNFDTVIKTLSDRLVDLAYPIKTEKWQGIDLSDKPEYQMRELLNQSFSCRVPSNLEELIEAVKPNLPWADVHFEERISGMPDNPGESYKIWPFYKLDDKVRTENTKFSHTYMERFWPKYAGETIPYTGKARSDHPIDLPNIGIRYDFGDLQDVINLLIKEPLTRQAYLPVWFPEDTGVLHGGRVPCTIGYHFIIRGGYIHIVYQLRSCDFIRHFRDDIYLACKLLNYITHKLNFTDLKIGTLTMHITSLHCFESDYQILKKNATR